MFPYKKHISNALVKSESNMWK